MPSPSQSTETRYWLRFESGEQDGHRVPLPVGELTIGRLEENEIVVAHSSVSGRHARFDVQVGDVRLVDLGSTNGLKVDGERVDTRRLAHGDQILIGRVAMVFEDQHVLGSEGAGFDVSPPAEDGLQLAAVGQSALERAHGAGARGGRGTGLVLGLLLVGALALAAWQFDLVGALGGGGVERGAPGPVPETPGNLLADGSFESDEGTGWDSAEAGTLPLRTGALHARSGLAGLGVVLEGEDWALARSAPLRLPDRRAVELRAWVSAEAAAQGRVGLEMTPAGGAQSGPSTIAWAPAVSDTGGFQEVILAFDLLPSHRDARVVLAARALPGEAGASDAAVSFDDLSVVVTEPTGDGVTFDDYELRVLGNPGSTAALLRSGRVLFGSLSLSQWTGGRAPEGWAGAAWAVRATDTGFSLTAVAGPAAAPAPDNLRCHAVPFGQLPLEREDVGSTLVVTVGPTGYREHALPFERADATDLMVGGGVNLIRFGFEAPRATSASVGPAGARLGFGFDPTSRLDLQVEFGEERRAAIELAARAREAQAEGRPGQAIALWTELLDEHPFEAGLIDEAGTQRSTLEQQGVERVEAIREDFERASFFQLSELYRACLARARAAARAFEGSATEAECGALVERIAAGLAQLGGPGASGREARLAGVLDALRAEPYPALRGMVEHELEASPDELTGREDH